MSTAMTGKRALRFKISAKGEERFPQGTPKTCPEEGVYHEFRLLKGLYEGALFESPSLLRSRGLFKDFRSPGSSWPHLWGEPGGDEKSLHPSPAKKEVPGQGEAVSAVVPRTAEDHHGLSLEGAEPLSSMAATTERRSPSKGSRNPQLFHPSSRVDSVRASTERIIFPPLSLHHSTPGKVPLQRFETLYSQPRIPFPRRFGFSMKRAFLPLLLSASCLFPLTGKDRPEGLDKGHELKLPSPDH